MLVAAKFGRKEAFFFSFRFQYWKWTAGRAVSSLHQIQQYKVHFRMRGEMFSIASYYQNKIINLSGVQWCELAIDFEKERRAKEAAFTSRACRVMFIKLGETCVAQRAAWSAAPRGAVCAAQTVASWLPRGRVPCSPAAEPAARSRSAQRGAEDLANGAAPRRSGS